MSDPLFFDKNPRSTASHSRDPNKISTGALSAFGGILTYGSNVVLVGRFIRAENGHEMGPFSSDFDDLGSRL